MNTERQHTVSDLPKRQYMLRTRAIVTIAGDHAARWRQVFRILDEALETRSNDQRSETVRAVRQGQLRRAS